MEQAGWWGDFRFEAGASRLWRLAGLDLRVTRTMREWQIEALRSPLQQEDEQPWELLDRAGDHLADAALSRHLFNQTGDRLRVVPALADRPVVIKPLNPLFIPAGQSATLFVSTPLWVQMSVDPVAAPLLDMPVIRPSDTWFGSTPVHGQVCYATKVFGRTELSQLPLRPFRAVTPVKFSNQSDGPMPLERLSMPMPLLDLYAATDNRLWTPGLNVERHAGARHPRVRIDSRIHPEAGVVRLLGRARAQDEDTLSRMFEHLLD